VSDAATGGWHAQPLALKLLLFGSLAAVAVGVVRCSMEATAPVSEDITVIGVSPVLVVGDETSLGAPPDTLARRIGRIFVGALAEATGVPVVADTSGDATVELRLRKWEGQLRLTGEVLDGETGRLVGAVRIEGPLGVLDGMSRAVANQAARALRLDRRDGE